MVTVVIPTFWTILPGGLGLGKSRSARAAPEAIRRAAARVKVKQLLGKCFFMGGAFAGLQVTPLPTQPVNSSRRLPRAATYASTSPSQAGTEQVGPAPTMASHTPRLAR